MLISCRALSLVLTLAHRFQRYKRQSHFSGRDSAGVAILWTEYSPSALIGVLPLRWVIFSANTLAICAAFGIFFNIQQYSLPTLESGQQQRDDKDENKLIRG